MPDRLDHLRHRVEHAPSDPDALTELGRAYLEDGRFEQADALLQLALEVDPGWYPAAISLAVCRSQTRDHDGAMKILHEAAQQTRQNEDPEGFDRVREAMESISRHA